MISIEQLIQRLEVLQEENNDEALEVSIDIFNRLRRNISGRNALYGYLSDDMWRDLEW